MMNVEVTDAELQWREQNKTPVMNYKYKQGFVKENVGGF